ncbi:MAG: putative RNA polymerase sigma factor FecI [Stenotrophomonas maltophilia]|uniref:Putative RNA polymerase sigma factor FecI n=1 Tax=Stenotrophomonas maltophilia TaxID=40324 RepID=A0A7V8FJ97_STEMA|nr:MAG: putative RNA polymerase sigma factor FecI [Stenotrophomonas maltophilia]
MSQAGGTWARIFTEHGATLRGFFIRRGAREDAEDLVQETYLRMLRAREARGEAIANPEAYLYTVALNLAREQAVRQQQVTLQNDDIEAFSNLLRSADAAEDDAVRLQRQRRLQELLVGLPDRTRAVLVMQYRDSMSYLQIAERIGISTHMVKKHVVNGLAACRRALAAQGEAW